MDANRAAFGTLCFAATTLLLTSAAAAQGEIKLRGIVRDFKQAHDDMDVLPVGGTGHYAGNIGLSLNTAKRPVFSGGGARVWNQWRDGDNNPIAPHLYMVGGVFGNATSIPVDSAGNTPSHGEFDTWDSSLGAYGGANVGPAPTYLPGAPMPTVIVPASLTGMTSLGDATYGSDVTISSNVRFDSLTISTKMTVVGHISILCDTFHLSTQAAIEIAPDSSLTLYTMNGGSSWNHVEINVNTGNPSLVTIFNLGINELMIHNHAEVYARLISPNAQLEITNHGALFGSFIGETVDFGNHGDLHLDTNLYVPMDACGDLITDTEGSFATASAGGIDSAASFDQWYSDVPGVNFSVQHSIALTDNGSGVYEYHDDAFYPIDGRLFGNEGQSHNHYFTFTFNAFFTYSQCADQFFEFAGADDCWVFINDQLALDLGGIIPGTNQVIPIDRMGLTDGDTCELRFFYAQRQGSGAAFHMRTNLQLQTDPFVATASAGFD